MRTTTDVFGIRPGAMRAWLTLSFALSGLEEQGSPTVCQVDPDPFTSDDKHERAEAAEACRLSRCPVTDPCRAFCLANDERWGVWAGVDLSDPKQRRAFREDYPA